MADSYKEKIDKVRKEQKKRADLRKKTKLMTGGLDDGKVPLKKSTSSKLGSSQKSSGSKNPTSVFQNMKTKEKDTKKKSDGRSFLQKYILGEKFQPKANKNKSPGALGGKLNEKTTTNLKKMIKKLYQQLKKITLKSLALLKSIVLSVLHLKLLELKVLVHPLLIKVKSLQQYVIQTYQKVLQALKLKD
jgi:hypothetical protein